MGYWFWVKYIYTYIVRSECRDGLIYKADQKTYELAQQQ
jgi:hypothetical protein